jgi:hypothetical protein
MADFRSLEDVGAWVQAKGPGGVEKLRGRLDTGAISGTGATFASAWLKRHDRLQAGEAQSKEQELMERATLASEVSASAALDAARWAYRSMVWTGVASLIAGAALLVSTYAAVSSNGNDSRKPEMTNAASAPAKR